MLEESERLKLFYDAELKKMLAYITAVVSSLAVQVTIFIYSSSSVKVSSAISLFSLIVISFSVWFSSWYFFIMAGTKYFELKQLENKLGITDLMWSLYPDWNFFSKLLHQWHSEKAGVRKQNWKRFSRLLDIITFLLIIITTILFGIVLYQLLK